MRAWKHNQWMYVGTGMMGMILQGRVRFKGEAGLSVQGAGTACPCVSNHVQAVRAVGMSLLVLVPTLGLGTSTCS